MSQSFQFEGRERKRESKRNIRCVSLDVTGLSRSFVFRRGRHRRILLAIGPLRRLGRRMNERWTGPVDGFWVDCEVESSNRAVD